MRAKTAMRAASCSLPVKVRTNSSDATITMKGSTKPTVIARPTAELEVAIVTFCPTSYPLLSFSHLTSIIFSLASAALQCEATLQWAHAEV